jgi:hypothetical protein
MSYHKIEKSTLGTTPAKRSHETALATIAPKPPELKHGNDAKRAKELNKLIKDAEAGLVRILKVGFFLECLGEDLPHGQLGPWVQAHCNRDWRTVRRWKQVAAGIGDALGITLKQRLEYKLHEVLALPLKKVPEELKAVREKIDAEIAGKSYRQLFLELKQVDEGNPTKPHRGQLPGSKGLTKEMRDKAAQRAEQDRLNNLEDEINKINDRLLELADAKNLGAMDSKLLKRHADACDTASGFAKRVLAARANEKGGQA